MSSNSRELHAVLYSVMAAAPRLRNSVVLVETDNSTTMAYVNHLGGRSRFLSAVAHRLWSVTNSYGITLRAVHRPGVEKWRADLLSRWRQDSTDLKLDPRLFRLADRKWGPHTVDLFATRLNTQLARFVSWRPDPSMPFSSPSKERTHGASLQKPSSLAFSVCSLGREQQSLSLLLGGQASLGGPISLA